MKQHLIICDMDGTLFDTNGANFAAYQKAMQEAGYPLTQEMFRRHCMNGAPYRAFAPLLGIRAEDQAAIHQRKTALYPSCFDQVRENTALFHLLEAAHETTDLALVTTAAHKSACRLLAHFHREALFDIVIAQEDVTHAKPDPEGFFLAMERCGHSASETAIFEDSETGLAAARATGATVFAVERF